MTLSNSISSQVQDTIDPEMVDFIQTKVNSLVQWDLLHFFQKNPHTAETAEHIADYTARDVDEVEAELTDLVKVRLLESKTVSRKRIYALTSDQHTRQQIQQFVRACDDRDFRMYTIRRITGMV